MKRVPVLIEASKRMALSPTLSTAKSEPAAAYERLRFEKVGENELEELETYRRI